MYFDKFPRTLYRIQRTEYEQPVNILTRVGVLADVLSNLMNYYEYTIQQGETPEILANKLYGNTEYHWLILLTNRIHDAQYDWPMNDDVFKKYIASKYGSLSTAKTQYAKWYEVTRTVDGSTGTITDHRHSITEYDYDNSLYSTDLGDGDVYTIGGYTTTVYTFKTREYAYDIEYAANDDRRNIKILRSEYKQRILADLDRILAGAGGNTGRSRQRSLTL